MYKAGHIFTYLLLKESVANDVINLDQSVVNHAIDEWRRRLSACVDAEGGHFEHYLCLLLSKLQCRNGITINLITGHDLFCSLLL